MKLDIVMENVRAMKNCGSHPYRNVFQSLSNFEFPPAISSNYFFAAYICYSGNISFLCPTRSDCLLGESTRDGINAIQKLRISFRLSLSPDEFLCRSFAEIQLKMCVIEG